MKHRPREAPPPLFKLAARSDITVKALEGALHVGLIALPLLLHERKLLPIDAILAGEARADLRLRLAEHVLAALRLRFQDVAIAPCLGDELIRGARVFFSAAGGAELAGVVGAPGVVAPGAAEEALVATGCEAPSGVACCAKAVAAHTIGMDLHSVSAFELPTPSQVARRDYCRTGSRCVRALNGASGRPRQACVALRYLDFELGYQHHLRRQFAVAGADSNHPLLPLPNDRCGLDSQHGRCRWCPYRRMYLHWREVKRTLA